jgi:uracil-DNA glycosylase
MTAPRISPVLRPNCKYAIVGEAPGANEMVDGRPFTGASGQLLRKMLEESGYVWDELTLTNVFLERPDANKIERFFLKVKAMKALGHDVAGRRKHPTYGYVDPRLQDEIPRLLAELDACGCDTVIACGGVALWALGFDHAISKHRGVLQKLKLPSGREVSVIGTYHPAAVLREWSYRPVVVADLKKALTGQNAQRRKRTIRIPQTLKEAKELLAKLASAPFIAYDIETEARQITCISLAPSDDEVVVLPFWDKTQPDGCAWNVSDELLLWRALKKLFDQPRKWLTQNGTYDMAYLRELGIIPNGTWEDTMLLHHAIYCEQPKSLGFLGSLYASEMQWKELRVKRSKGKDVKAEE